MKKLLFFLLFVSASFSIFAQEDEEGTNDKNRPHVFSLGINSGVYFNINACRDNVDLGNKNYSFYTINPHVNYGIDLGIKWSPKIRTRFELKYTRMSYGFDVNYNYTHLDDQIYLTNVVAYLYNYDLNFQFDYMVYSNSKLQFSLSPGIINEYVKAYDFKNKSSNGDIKYGKDLGTYTSQYRNYMLGLNISGVFRYEVLKNRIALTATPGITYYYRNFKVEDNKPYFRFGLTAGMEFYFW
jgi:hypothetical protein